MGAKGSSRNHSSAPWLRDFCTAITIKALETELGYAHVPDVRQIGETSLTCELCDFLKLALITRTQECMPVDAKGSIKTVEGALERLSPYLGEKKINLQERCPVFLTMQSNMLARPQELHIRLSHTMGRYVTLISIGYIYLQRFARPPLLLPRLEEDKLVNQFAYIFKESEQQAKIKDPRSRNKDDYEYPQERGLPPHRLLDLGDDLRNREGDLCLVEHLDCRVNYATLSYSWGSYRGCTTTQKSLSDRRNIIKFSDLPKAFQQAVYLTRRMGIRYLWIDALCIIQDSAEDWTKEASLMADIYRNCRIRIAANATRDPTQSFYPPKPIVTSLRLRHLDSKYSKCFITLPKSYSDDVESAYLNTRAWVLQERMLAANTIHFSEDHIYLETIKTIVGEDFIPAGQNVWSAKSCIEKFGTGRSRLMQIQPGNSMGNSDVDRIDLSDAWHRIVELYSDCNMTYSTDKLIAIGGLVRDRQKRGKFPYLHSKYYLGLWESTIHEDLLWITHDPHALLPITKVSKKLKYISTRNLPSWTWTAYDGPITFMKDSGDLQIPWTMKTSPISELDIVDFTGPLDAEQLPLREPVSMMIRVRCARIPQMRLGSCGTPNYDYRKDKEYIRTSPFRHNPNTDNRPELLSTRKTYLDLRDQDSEIIGFATMDTMEEVSPASELWCAHIATQHDERYYGPDPLRRSGFGPSILPVALHKFRMSKGKDCYQETEDSYVFACCLILEPTGSAQDEYRRVGVAQVKYEWICIVDKQIINLV